MLDILKKLLDLPSEARLGSTWLVVLTVVLGVDAYAIARLDQSLLTLLRQSPELMAAAFQGHWPIELFFALTAAVVTWFYLLPLVVVPIWSWLVDRTRAFMPEWLEPFVWPERSKGWQRLTTVRLQAIEQNNALLLSACDERARAARSREMVLRCVLGVFLFTTVAGVSASDASGPSLLGGLVEWVMTLSPLWHGIAFIVALPAFALVWAVLVERGAHLDGYIQLDAQKADRGHSSS